MKRILMKHVLVALLLASLAGCAGFDEVEYQEHGPEFYVPASAGCQAPPVANSAAYPTPQTREPELSKR
jgi:hypothetical protein